MFGGLRTSFVAGVIAIVIVAAGVVQFVRPIPALVAHASTGTSGTIRGAAPALPWPSGVQATLDIPGIGSFGEKGPITAAPIGSVAKMMTAYLVLKAHPLGLYSLGPTITVTPQDVTMYQSDAASQQSVMPVVAGEKLTERKLLEGLLIASGNNVATMLADWVGGNTKDFVASMNQSARQIGLTNTHYVSPSGLNPGTVSTASDQVKLAEFLMKIPVFAELVAMPQMTVPGQSQLDYNYNYYVGHDGIIGIKTGSTLESGGVFIFAGNRILGDQRFTVYGGVVGQPGTKTASQLVASLQDGKSLLDAVSGVVSNHTVMKSGSVVGTVTAPWQPAVNLVTTKPVSLLGWGGMAYRVHLRLKPVTAHVIAANSVVGALTVATGSQTITVPVATESSLKEPSLAWRMTRL